ncbi:MAG: hypothetical protein WAP35_06185 [Solirubrobacterales bacterium]
MGTHVRDSDLPERIVAVSVGVVYGRRGYGDAQPELLAPSELGVAVVDCSEGEPQTVRRYALSGADLRIAADHLVDLDLPIVGYNPLRFDWLSLEACCEIDELIARTIDLRSVLYGQVAELVDAEGAADAFPRHGSYGILNFDHLIDNNQIDRDDGDDASPTGATTDAELTARLWHRLVTTERALIAGRVYSLPDDQLAQLCGQAPHFDSPSAWRLAVRDRPAPKPYRKRARHPVGAPFPRVDQRYV